MLKPADILVEWSWLRPALVQLKARTGEGWQPEDVLRTVLNEDAHLLVSPGEGFVVWTLQTDQWSGARIFLVWLAWGRSSSGESLIQKHMPQLEWAAQQCGAQRMRLVTPRRGFERALGEGWRMTVTSFERAVP